MALGEDISTLADPRCHDGVANGLVWRDEGKRWVAYSEQQAIGEIWQSRLDTFYVGYSWNMLKGRGERFGAAQTMEAAKDELTAAWWRFVSLAGLQKIGGSNEPRR